MIEEGRKAPNFTLQSVEGGALTLKDCSGKPVVVYSYPRDGTPGCTREACAFRDFQGQIRKTGAVVLGVSPDSVASHQRSTGKHRLNFPLLSDSDKSVEKEYGAYFIVDGQGVVRKVFPEVKVDGHAERVLGALRDLGGRSEA